MNARALIPMLLVGLSLFAAPPALATHVTATYEVDFTGNYDEWRRTPSRPAFTSPTPPPSGSWCAFPVLRTR